MHTYIHTHTYLYTYQDTYTQFKSSQISFIADDKTITGRSQLQLRPITWWGY